MAEFKATGPISKRGREKSSRNAVKHGLNVAVTPESDPLFHELARDLLESGYSHEQAIEVSRAMLEFRRATTVYADTYWGTIYEGEQASSAISGLTEQIMASKSMAMFEKALSSNLVKRARKELAFGSVEVKRGLAVHKLIRYQRKAVSSLSKALCRAR